ncbi:MAG: acetate--CoA ligase family protein [Crocinitomicaceae bacterium]|nr:acetate--CoA ligase family protein [Crocinitomicaceae bacterium]
MLIEKLINPESIVVVGGSNDIRKPGGKILKNLLQSNYQGHLHVLNPSQKEVQGLESFQSINDLPNVDLAIIVIPATICLETIKVLAYEKETKAFIIISSGFAELGEDGKAIEKDIVQVVNEVDGCLVGPNCIGVLNINYAGVFTTPLPELSSDGCDLISSSGATAVFIMEAGMIVGLKFNSIYSVGNAAQIGIEEILEIMDEKYVEGKDSKIKLLYIESLRDPIKFLKHTRSLIKKGVKIAAIKSGTTDVGIRAAASHTGAMASSDKMIRALFEKAGIVYCSSRKELISIASIFNYKPLQGKRIAIITHAGGSAVMLADALSSGGLEVPAIEGENADKLLNYLDKGSSVSNPIDFLATGTAEQLGIIIDYCEHKFDHIDAMVVVFGSPGLFDVENVYNVLSVKLDICSKPIYPVLPSLINANDEIQGFLSQGHVNFPDEVVLGNALSHVFHTRKPNDLEESSIEINKQAIRDIIENGQNGFLHPQQVSKILDAIGINRTKESIVDSEEQLISELRNFNYPIVMKCVGPIHKSDFAGVVLGIVDQHQALSTYHALMKIENASAVMIQASQRGIELYVGAVKEDNFGHAVLCGIGGVFIEVLNDVSMALTPIYETEARSMLLKLKGYQVFKGIRGKEAVNEELMVEVIRRISLLVEVAPEIVEIDLNPLMGTKDYIISVDARIRIEK